MTPSEIAIKVTQFWRLVEQHGETECWPWLGSRDPDGYGLFFYDGRTRRAHELALTFATGEVRLPYLDTCHSCHNPPCCNPKHLRFDTRKSNMHDMIKAGRAPRPSQILSDEEVRIIRERRQAGAAQQDLADQYGVSDGLISDIVNGKRRLAAGGPIAAGREYRRRTRSISGRRNNSDSRG